MVVLVVTTRKSAATLRKVKRVIKEMEAGGLIGDGGVSVERVWGTVFIVSGSRNEDVNDVVARLCMAVEDAGGECATFAGYERYEVLLHVTYCAMCGTTYTDGSARCCGGHTLSLGRIESGQILYLATDRDLDHAWTAVDLNSRALERIVPVAFIGRPGASIYAPCLLKLDSGKVILSADKDLPVIIGDERFEMIRRVNLLWGDWRINQALLETYLVDLERPGDDIIAQRRAANLRMFSSFVMPMSTLARLARTVDDVASPLDIPYLNMSAPLAAKLAHNLAWWEP